MSFLQQEENRIGRILKWNKMYVAGNGNKVVFIYIKCEKYMCVRERESEIER
jgi:hypothetical protein